MFKTLQNVQKFRILTISECILIFVSSIKVVLQNEKYRILRLQLFDQTISLFVINPFLFWSLANEKPSWSSLVGHRRAQHHADKCPLPHLEKKMSGSLPAHSFYIRKSQPEAATWGIPCSLNATHSNFCGGYRPRYVTWWSWSPHALARESTRQWVTTYHQVYINTIPSQHFIFFIRYHFVTRFNLFLSLSSQKAKEIFCFLSLNLSALSISSCLSLSLSLQKMKAAPIRMDRKTSIESEPRTLRIDQMEFARVLF